jgi:putative phage-type endonuclease
MALARRQLEMRRSAIGASEIGTVAGLTRFGSLIDLWRSKVEGVEQRHETYRMRLGTEIEAPLARVWAKQRGVYLARVDTLRDLERPHAIATPDRAVYLDAKARGNGRIVRANVRDAAMILQVKSSGWRMRSAWGAGVDVFDPEAPKNYSDEIPDEYFAQVQWEMGVAGVPACAVIVDFDKAELLEYRVSFDADTFGALYDLADRFMLDHVNANRPPPPDWTERYAAWVVERFPQERDRTQPPRLLLPEHEPEVWAAVQRVLALREIGARVDASIEQHRRVVELAIGVGTGLAWNGGQVTWLKNKDGTREDVAAKALDLERIASLAVQALPAGAVRETLAGQLQTARTAHMRPVAGSRVMRWKVANGPKRIGEDKRAGVVELGGAVLDLPPVSAPRVTTDPAAPKEATEPEAPKEGTP